MDAEQITSGTYSPVTGFMNAKELDSILNANQTIEGVTWTMPIILQVSKDQASKISAKQRIRLTNKENEILYCLEVDSVFKINLEEFSHKWF